MSEANLLAALDSTPRLRQLVRWVWYNLPEGRPLPDAVWHRRHRAILVLLWLHAISLMGFGLIMGVGLSHSLIEGGLVALSAVVAGWAPFTRRVRAAVACLGLITASGVLVHLSGGYIEMHFHFFVMVVVISLYQDWIPFLLTIGYVVLHHGTVGILDPHSVYNHPDAWLHPWKWALIHGVFVLAASIASVVNWRLTEAVRAQSDLLLQAAGDGIWGIDRAGRTAFVNLAAVELLGWSPGELVGRPVQEFLRLAQPAGTFEPDVAIAQALREGVAQPRQTALFARKDETTFLGEYVCRPIRERGQITGVVITFQDISGRQQAEADRLADLEERRRTQEHLVELQQVQIANLSTPLIPLAEQVVLMPLIGLLDAQRSTQVTTMLLEGIAAHQAKVAIVDVSGVPIMDTPAANALIRAARAARLLGTELVVTGLRPEVAQTLVGLGSDLTEVVTANTLQTGVKYALKRRNGSN
jgi:PAS domain S-box-containing protein